MKRNLTDAGDDLRAHFAGLSAAASESTEPGVIRLLREITESNLFGDTA